MSFVNKVIAKLRELRLQALTAMDNPFEEDKNSTHIDTDRLAEDNHEILYTISQQTILAALDSLKYLDNLPIDEAKRKHFKEAFSHQASSNENSTANKKTQEQQEDENKKLTCLREACAEEMHGFSEGMVKKIKEELEDSKSLDELPEFTLKLTSFKKNTTNKIEEYIKVIIKIDQEKKQVQAQKLEKIEISLQNFVEKSKDMIKQFKYAFKAFIKDELPSVANKPFEELSNRIKLSYLKDDLMEIEIHLKKAMREKLTDLTSTLKSKNSDINSQLTKMKEDLDILRKGFVNDMKEKITSIENELKTKQDNRTEEDDRLEAVQK